MKDGNPGPPTTWCTLGFGAPKAFQNHLFRGKNRFSTQAIDAFSSLRQASRKKAKQDAPRPRPRPRPGSPRSPHGPHSPRRPRSPGSRGHARLRCHHWPSSPLHDLCDNLRSSQSGSFQPPAVSRVSCYLRDWCQSAHVSSCLRPGVRCSSLSQRSASVVRALLQSLASCKMRSAISAGNVCKAQLNMTNGAGSRPTNTVSIKYYASFSKSHPLLQLPIDLPYKPAQKGDLFQETHTWHSVCKKREPPTWSSSSRRLFKLNWVPRNWAKRSYLSASGAHLRKAPSPRNRGLSRTDRSQSDPRAPNRIPMPCTEFRKAQTVYDPWATKRTICTVAQPKPCISSASFSPPNPLSVLGRNGHGVFLRTAYPCLFTKQVI